MKNVDNKLLLYCINLVFARCANCKCPTIFAKENPYKILIIFGYSSISILSPYIMTINKVNTKKKKINRFCIASESLSLNSLRTLTKQIIGTDRI